MAVYFLNFVFALSTFGFKCFVTTCNRFITVKDIYSCDVFGLNITCEAIVVPIITLGARRVVKNVKFRTIYTYKLAKHKIIILIHFFQEFVLPASLVD